MQMAYGGQPFNSYLAQKVNSASAEELGAMLLQGAERFLHQAVTAIHQHDFMERGRLLNRVADILHELVRMLNPDAGSEVHDRLEGLLTFWIRESYQGSWKNQPDRLERVARQMATLRSGWEQLARPAAPIEIPVTSSFSLEGLVG